MKLGDLLKDVSIEECHAHRKWKFPVSAMILGKLHVEICLRQ